MASDPLLASLDAHLRRARGGGGADVEHRTSTRGFSSALDSSVGGRSALPSSSAAVRIASASLPRDRGITESLWADDGPLSSSILSTAASAATRTHGAAVASPTSARASARRRLDSHSNTDDVDLHEPLDEQLDELRHKVDRLSERIAPLPPALSASVPLQRPLSASALLRESASSPPRSPLRYSTALSPFERRRRAGEHGVRSVSSATASRADGGIPRFSPLEAAGTPQGKVARAERQVHRLEFDVDDRDRQIAELRRENEHLQRRLQLAQREAAELSALRAEHAAALNALQAAARTHQAQKQHIDALESDVFALEAELRLREQDDAIVRTVQRRVAASGAPSNGAASAAAATADVASARTPRPASAPSHAYARPTASSSAASTVTASSAFTATHASGRRTLRSDGVTLATAATRASKPRARTRKTILL